jgi:hypothetical protein
MGPFGASGASQIHLSGRAGPRRMHTSDSAAGYAWGSMSLPSDADLVGVRRAVKPRWCRIEPLLQSGRYVASASPPSSTRRTAVPTDDELVRGDTPVVRVVDGTTNRGRYPEVVAPTQHHAVHQLSLLPAPARSSFDAGSPDRRLNPPGIRRDRAGPTSEVSERRSTTASRSAAQALPWTWHLSSLEAPALRPTRAGRFASCSDITRIRRSAQLTPT